MREKISKKLICFKTLHSFQLIVLMIGKSIDWQLMRKLVIDNAFVPDLVHERQFLVLRLRLMIFSFGSLPSFFSTFDEWMDLESHHCWRILDCQRFRPRRWRCSGGWPRNFLPIISRKLSFLQLWLCVTFPKYLAHVATTCWRNMIGTDDAVYVQSCAAVHLCLCRAV